MKYTLYITYANGSFDIIPTSGDALGHVLRGVLAEDSLSVAVSASNVVGEGPRTNASFTGGMSPFVISYACLGNKCLNICDAFLPHA